MTMIVTQIFIVILSLFIFNLHLSAAIDGRSYKPSDSILLNCGSPSDEADADGRKWIGDSSPKISAAGITFGNSTPSQAAFQDPSLPSSIPYMTAAVFQSEATYKFPVRKDERHLIRLHFYPASYNGLNAEDGFFGVTASGGLTLLHNFSAYITAQALTQGYIVREFSLPPAEEGFITLTFKPEAKHPAAFAFVNGIEVISMPEMFDDASTMVGFDDSSLSVGSSALQTMYRLNVGGNYIAPSNDTGLGRTWYDDTPYITGAGVGVTAAAGPRVKIRYPADMPSYIAPVDLYRTARQMGPDPKVNIQYNLSWSFQIDANFTYMVRLHFCEIQLTKVNQRVFDVFINNQTAQKDVDIIAMTSSMAVPVYKDYAIFISGRPNEDDDDELLVELHPSMDAKPEYYDAILNGMEIFKLSDAGGNLAGPNPKPSEMLEDDLQTMREFKSEPRGKFNVIGGAAGGAAAAAGLVFALVLAVYQRKKRAIAGEPGSSGWQHLYGNSQTTGSKSTMSAKSCASSHLSTMAACLCRHFSIAEIKQATKNFDETLVIGVGGFGKVYKGNIDGGTTKVAIKRSNPDSQQGVHEFQTEIEMLSKLRHKHLVSLIGYCEEDNEMCLVYDYMAYGTLREHLYKTNKPSLPWKQRLEISIGAARGLHYLHTGAKYTIIHRDVKTTNILVDEKWVAKVSDFGLSKTGPTTMNQSHVSTVVKGSFGYLDPEYFRRQQLTDKSDVYSFGVVLFEILCARPALNPSLSKEQVSLADWALHNQRKGTLTEIIDPVIKGKINSECLKKFAETAVKCLSDHGIDRPSMGDVLWNLEFALQLQESFENGGASAGGSIGDVSELSAGGEIVGGGYRGQSRDEEDESNEQSDGGSDMAVFSQLVDPKGR